MTTHPVPHDPILKPLSNDPYVCADCQQVIHLDEPHQVGYDVRPSHLGKCPDRRE